ncbi:S1 family peptidase [Actinosynnema sp. NPDC020468]|uniref:S1 family peptidase n=1 Tax=Actinosynnema sp. NPDC020468 TaxID=3154488 RepID=UPI0033D8EA57
MKRVIRATLAATSVIALGWAATTVAAAAPDRGAEPTSDVASAVRRDLGLTPEQAGRRATAQDRADRVDDRLAASLGPAFGGAYFDAASGLLVVGVTDAGQVAAVTAAGARARVVGHGLAELDAIKDALDVESGRVFDGKRAVQGKPATDAVKGLVSWSVDAESNAVVVTALRTGSQDAVSRLAKHGDAVKVEYTDAAPRTAAFLDGGDELNYPAGGCSAGFDLRNPGTGARYLLTAGHCGPAGSVVRGQGNVVIGTVASAYYPTYDDALITVTNTGAWTQGPWVDVNPSNGGVVVVSGYSDSPVGTAICKSGRTTRLTCGSITAKNETVTYVGGQTVYNLTRHNACVEPGDSGGATFRNSGTRTAEGVTSGALLYLTPIGTLRCGQAVGAATVSWSYPAAISVPFYTAVYGASLW